MNNWIQATPERERLRPRRGRLPASFLPMLLLLGGFLLWLPIRAEGQLAISHIADTNVPINRLLHIQVSVTPSNILPSQLNFSLTSAPSNTEATNASITLNNGDFTWVPTQTQSVAFTVSVTNLGTTFRSEEHTSELQS